MSTRARAQAAASQRGRAEQQADILARIPVGEPIESILSHPRREGRFQVIVAGKAVATVSASVVGRLSLASGSILNEGLTNILAHECVVLAAYDKAVALLAVRDRGTVELQRRLVRYGFEAGAAAQAVDLLAEQGLLNDGRLARQLARSRLASGKAGRRRVEQELARMGVARDVAQAAISDVVSEDTVNEEASALALARRRARTFEGLDHDVARRRLYGFLSRRGFDSSVVISAVDAAVAEMRDREVEDAESEP